MNQAKSWGLGLPLLGGALLSLIAITGCGNGSNAGGGLVGFASVEGPGGGGFGTTTGNATSEAPYLEVLNQTALAEFSINSTTALLTPVNFNTTGTAVNGVENTFALSGTPEAIAQVTIGFDSATGDLESGLFVSIGASIECLVVDDVTGVITPFVDPNTGQPIILTTGGTVVSLDTVGVLSANHTSGNTTETEMLYAVTNNNEINVFTVQLSPLDVLPLNFLNGSNTISTGVNAPIQMTDSYTPSGGSAPFLYVLNQAGGTGSIAGFTIDDGVTESGTLPGQLTALNMGSGANTVDGNGVTVPISFALFTSPVPGVVVVSQNDTLSTFTQQSTGAVGALVGSGNSVGLEVNTPSSVSTIGPAIFVTSTLGGTGSIESFEVQEQNANPNQLTIVAGGNGGSNSETTGVNLPASALEISNGLDLFLFDTNTQGTGTGSVGSFTVDTTNITLVPNNVQAGATNVISTGIVEPPPNPQNMVIVTGD